MEGSNGKCGKSRLCVGAFGIAIGVTWGLGVLILGILNWKFQYGTLWMHTLASIYIGFAPSLKGIIVGTVWALIDGFILGAIVALIYNCVCKCCHCKVCQPEPKP